MDIFRGENNFKNRRIKLKWIIVYFVKLLKAKYPQVRFMKMMIA